MSNADITDNTGQFMDALERATVRALEIIGGKAESYAKAEISNVVYGTPASWYVRTGALRNSITHAVDGDSVIVGSNMEYAPYVELGTGREYNPPPEWMEAHGKRGKGRDKWYFKDDNCDWHVGFPQKPRPFLRPAVENHTDEFKNIMNNELKNA